MSTYVRYVGEDNVPVYSTHEAAYAIGEFQSKVGGLAEYLWDGLQYAKENCGWELYNYCWKGFGEEIGMGRNSAGATHRDIESWAKLDGVLTRKDHVLLLSEIYDIRALEEEAGLQLGRTDIYPKPLVIASIRHMENNGALLHVYSIGSGIPVSPDFLYRAGEKFGELLDGS
jgi:hypothetical protein